MVQNLTIESFYKRLNFPIFNILSQVAKIEIQMMHIDIELNLRDKKEIERLVSVIKQYNVDRPVHILEFENSFSIRFSSDYEQYELIKDFSDGYDDHELIDDISSGNEEILLIINRVQSPLSTDDWGRRWNEDAINKTTYLVKRRNRVVDKPLTKLSVLFDEKLVDYDIPIYSAKYKDSEEQFYVLAKEYVDEGQNPELISKPMKTISEVFWYGYFKLDERIETDYAEFRKEQKKRKRSDAAKQAAKTRREKKQAEDTSL